MLVDKKKLWLKFFVLLIFCNLHSNPYAEYVSGGQVSKKIVKEYNRFLNKIKNSSFTNTIFKYKPIIQKFELRKTSEKLEKVYPELKYGGKIPIANFIYINEPFFNTLNEEEKTFFFALNMLSDRFLASELAISTIKISLAYLCTLGFFIPNSKKQKDRINIYSVGGCLPLLYILKKALYLYSIQKEKEYLTAKYMFCKKGGLGLLNKYKEMPDFPDKSELEDKIKNLNRLPDE